MKQRKLPPMNQPELPSPTYIAHLRFVPEPSPGRPCVICQKPKPDWCERCGTPMHFYCWLHRVATEDERDRFLTVPQDWRFSDDAPWVNLLIMLCPGCRS